MVRRESKVTKKTMSRWWYIRATRDFDVFFSGRRYNNSHNHYWPRPGHHAMSV
jgi:hypothetical protein